MHSAFKVQSRLQSQITSKRSHEIKSHRYSRYMVLIFRVLTHANNHNSSYHDSSHQQRKVSNVLHCVPPREIRSRVFVPLGPALHARAVSKVFRRFIRRFVQDASHEMLEKRLLVWLRHGPRYADRPNNSAKRNITRRLLELANDRRNGGVNASFRRMSAR
jgi:hypothetical protein